MGLAETAEMKHKWTSGQIVDALLERANFESLAKPEAGC